MGSDPGDYEVRPFERGDAGGVAALAGSVDWPALADPEVVARVCEAPGVVACSAVLGDHVVGWAQACGDGVLRAHLSFLAVHADHRRRGLGRLLVVATFQAAGAASLDLLAEVGAPAGFYEGFEHTRFAGFRLFPGA